MTRQTQTFELDERTYVLFLNDGVIHVRRDEQPWLRLSESLMRHLTRHVGALQGRPMNSGKPWSREDDDRLIESYHQEASLKGLGTVFGRSRTAIVARLAKHGLIEAKNTRFAIHSTMEAKNERTES